MSKSLSFKMLGHKYDFLLQIFLKLMHTSHDFIAIKTCTSYEFLVVFEQLRVWDRESDARVGMVCGAGAGRISQIPAGAGRV